MKALSRRPSGNDRTEGRHSSGAKTLLLYPFRRAGQREVDGVRMFCKLPVEENDAAMRLKTPVFSPMLGAAWIGALFLGLTSLSWGHDAIAVPFADNGGLKMLYDNRQYPHAVAVGGKTHIVWRGQDGFPYCRSYDLERRTFSEPLNLIEGYEDEIDAERYSNDHHYAPVIWSDQNGYLHTLFGCHRTTGIHLVSVNPGDSSQWRRGNDFSESISYPKIHRIYDDKTLVYTRYSGHLGFWQYPLSNDGGHSWEGGGRPVVNLGADPQAGDHAAYSGYYNTTAVSADGKRLHVAFIWNMEDPLFNTRYGKVLGDHTQRYNLYYLYVDLTSGKGYNIDGVEVPLPLRKWVADEKCLVWDTDERTAAVGPSICLDDADQPQFLLPVSEETPLDSAFYFVTRITKTLHPFNASCLQRDANGVLRAYMVTGSGESLAESEKGLPTDMDGYGYGRRVEKWISSDGGESWRLDRNLTPVPGLRYQNVQIVSDGMSREFDDLFLFYGWKDERSPGIGYLWDARE